MKILVTGNLGYIGSVLTRELTALGHDVFGLDVGYFRDCMLAEAPAAARQIIKDIRDIEINDLEGVEGIIHLAGLSNDPLGEFDPRVTDAINRDATVRLAALAKSRGVSRFVYASSQSMYGVSGTDEELDEDTSDKKPITAYARTKWEAEVRIKEFADADFTVVCMRPSTVFGSSPRLRCDIVFNNLVACAFTTGRIEIKSDGTPWRPVVHVRDVCSAFRAGLEAPAGIVNARSYNVGIPNGNFTVRQLAEAAQRSVPGSTLTFTGEHGSDSRTYRVGFGRILTELAEWYRPEWDLDRGGAELVEFFGGIGFTEADFRGEKCIRLARLKQLTDSGAVDGEMRFVRL